LTSQVVEGRLSKKGGGGKEIDPPKIQRGCQRGGTFKRASRKIYEIKKAFAT